MNQPPREEGIFHVFEPNPLGKTAEGNHSCMACWKYRSDPIHQVRVAHVRELSPEIRDKVLNLRILNAEIMKKVRRPIPTDLGDRDEGYNGMTFAVIWYGAIRFVGVSLCSENDSFDRKRGSLIALNRANYQIRMASEPGCFETPFRFAFTPYSFYYPAEAWKKVLVDLMPSSIYLPKEGGK